MHFSDGHLLDRCHERFALGGEEILVGVTDVDLDGIEHLESIECWKSVVLG